MSFKAFLTWSSLSLALAGLPVLAQAQTAAPPAADKSPPLAVALPPAGALPPPATTNQSPPPVAAAASDVPPPLPAAPVPPPLPPQAQYFYNDGGKPGGPLNLADLQAKIAAGAITSSTLVWKSGTPDWVAAKDLSDLSSSFGSPAIASNPVPIQPPAAGQPGSTMANVRSFFLGTWETDGPGPTGTQGLAKMVLTLAQDGSVLGTYTVSLSGTGAMVSIPVTGTWNATQLSGNMASMVLNLIVHATNGQQQSVNSTTTLQVIDQNTVRDITQGTITRRVTV